MRTAARAALAFTLACIAPAAVAGRDQSAGSARAVTLPTILAIEDARAPTREDLNVLLQALRGPLREPAIRALGRLQRRDVITDLLPFISVDRVRGETATALVLALGGRPLDGVPRGQQEQAVLDALLAAGAAELTTAEPAGLGAVARALGRLPYATIDQFKAAETLLRQIIEKPFPKLDDAPHADAAIGLESLARLNRKRFTLDEQTIDRLEERARTTDPRRVVRQRNALAALQAAQTVDRRTIEAALASTDMGVRRLAAISLGAAGTNFTDTDRLDFIRSSLQDRSFNVRLEALRAWVRHGVREQGCQPLVDAIKDQSLHVALAAIDALGDQCRDDATITDRLVFEMQTPPSVAGRWHRSAHAFVALAKRDRERTAIGMLTFATHNLWQVRMYAAQAAAIVEDVAALERLAADPDDNVAETALPPLRRLTGADSDPVFIAALKRTNRTISRNAPARPYQIVRTAARALENAQPTPELTGALISALERISAEACETSRDARLALIERLAIVGSAAQASALMPLLKDIDPVVATAAAELVQRWTGKSVAIDPQPSLGGNVPRESDLAERVRVVFTMDSGRTFEVAPLAAAPLTTHRFLAAVRRGYYDDLTFHRVVPNFVIQGGSPNANEYCGDCPFMRDEPGDVHRRGVLGISTRGRDTGDAQIFIDLVDNHRLDYDYTAFAAVCGDGMTVVDEIVEGDRISSVQVMPATRSCGG